MRITRWSRASSGTIESHQRSEQPKQWMSTIGAPAVRAARRAGVGDLDVAAGQAEDPAAVDVHPGVLGLAVDDEGVDRQQRDERDERGR